mmetsp:Transcript_65723/g.203492  ORF Transcript_65723/g.203492 Transcript_65723/m.203492 type:complete len:323 (-) Transcript_65723:88-1056(-)
MDAESHRPLGGARACGPPPPPPPPPAAPPSAAAAPGSASASPSSSASAHSSPVAKSLASTEEGEWKWQGCAPSAPGLPRGVTRREGEGEPPACGGVANSGMDWRRGCWRHFPWDAGEASPSPSGHPAHEDVVEARRARREATRALLAAAAAWPPRCTPVSISSTSMSFSTVSGLTRGAPAPAPPCASPARGRVLRPRAESAVSEAPSAAGSWPEWRPADASARSGTVGRGCRAPCCPGHACATLQTRPLSGPSAASPSAQPGGACRAAPSASSGTLRTVEEGRLWTRAARGVSATRLLRGVARTATRPLLAVSSCAATTGVP